MLKPFPIIVVGSLIGFAAVAEIRSAQDTAQSPRHEPVRRVGVSLPSNSAEIAAEQSGTIVDMPVADGDVVEKGQVLFKISSKLQDLRVQRLEALLGVCPRADPRARGLAPGDSVH